MPEKFIKKLKEAVEKTAIEQNDLGSAHAVAWVELPDDECLRSLIRDHRGELVEVDVRLGISIDNDAVANCVERGTVLVNLAEIEASYVRS